MDQLHDPRTSYLDILLPLFEKLKKHLNSRKQKDIRDACTRAMEQVNQDTTLLADNYFPIMKQALDTKIPKTMEVTLYAIQKLMAHNFLIGNGPDTCVYESPPQIVSIRTQRRLIDAIIESVCNCVHEKEDSVQLQVIKTLLTAVCNGNCLVHDRPLLEAFRACYHIYITSKNLVNQTTAKATLTQMLHAVFQRMETSVQDQGDEPREDALQKMLRVMLRNMVDDTCLFWARTEQFPAESIPLRAVPYTLTPGDPPDQSDLNADVLNEDNIQAGKFGWCVNCRKAADLYCRDSRDPVCSLECKEEHCAVIAEANEAMHIYTSDDQNDWFHDAHLVFRSICKLSLKEIANSSAGFTMRSKLLSLELILSLLENPGPRLRNKQQFLDVVRSSLCSSLATNCLSSERSIFTLSLSIFVALLNSHLDHLKPEIGVFLEQIFIRILESENSSYHHKLLVLQVIYRLTQNPKHTLELFLNYDCDLDEKDIIARVLDILARIAQGKYLRSEHLLQPQQEEVLRMCALETLTHMIISMAAWIENEKTSRQDTVMGASSEDDAVSDAGSADLSTLEKVEKSKLLKWQLSRAVHKFNFKAKTGIKLLAETGYLDPESAQDIAAFLKTTEGLNKTVVGDYLGGELPLNRKVLYAYVDLFDLKGMNLVQALRHFLSFFRLPGEAQKADRVLEKFSEKYFRDNPSAFEVADTAYVLSFAIIMLQTDAHNPGVKNKMTLDGFKTITKGINNGKDLPGEYIKEIYESIKTVPMTLADDEELKAKAEASNGQMNREDMFLRESKHIQAKSQEMFRNARRTAFQTGVEVDHIKPFFETVWPALLATFAVVLEESEITQAWKFALQGFLACSKVAAKFSMTTELEGFVSALANFTSLSPTRSSDIRERNVEAAKVLLLVAKSEANALRKSWRHVLFCLSRLDFLQFVHSGVESTLAVQRDQGTTSNTMVDSISPQETDYIFSLSSTLDDEAVVEFVQQLIEVSKSEIWDDSPRIFSLQALVTVADVNMTRVRLVWARLWAAMQKHITEAGLHRNEHIALFALDSLRQLSVKFLLKEEFANFHFQQEFLTPFPRILKDSIHSSVKEMLVDCVTNLIFTQDAHIRSGWKCVFQVLLEASTSPTLLPRCFKAIIHVVETDLDMVLEEYEALLNTVLNCAESQSDSISLRAMELIPICGEPLSREKTDPKYWDLLFDRLRQRLSDHRPHIQTKALESLFTVLSELTENFTGERWLNAWKLVMQPLFDEIALTPESSPHWVKTTFQQALLSYVELMRTKFQDLDCTFDVFVQYLKKTVGNSDEDVARVGVNSYLQFALSCSLHFSESHWTRYIAGLTDMLELTLPKELSAGEVDMTTLETAGALTFNPDVCVTKSIIHLLLIGIGRDVLDNLFHDMKFDHQIALLRAIRASHAFARSFNQQIVRRWKLWKDGFMKDLKTLPGLLKQEREALTCYLKHIFQVYATDTQVWGNLLSAAQEVLKDYIYKESKDQKADGSLGDVENGEAEREVVSLRPIIAKVLVPGIIECHEGKQLAVILKPEFLQLILSPNLEIRTAVKTVLEYAWG